MKRSMYLGSLTTEPEESRILNLSSRIDTGLPMGPHIQVMCINAAPLSHSLLQLSTNIRNWWHHLPASIFNSCYPTLSTRTEPLIESRQCSRHFRRHSVIGLTLTDGPLRAPQVQILPLSILPRRRCALELRIPTISKFEWVHHPMRALSISLARP